MKAFAILAALGLAACGDPKPSVVVQTRDVERRPPPTMMVPCAREPDAPSVLGGRASAGWVADVIAAGEECRRRADDLQRFHNTPAAKP